MKFWNKYLVVTLVLLLLMLPLLTACGGDEGEKGEITPSQTPKQVTITLGHITDLTGPGARAMSIVEAGLQDAVNYFNENNSIPGVKLEVISYDNQYDPSRDIPGYQRMLDRGADIIIANMPQTPIILKPFIDKDEVLVFSMPYTEEGFLPPGYAFSLNVPTGEFGPTMMKWIAENDPDFPKDRPAKFGAVNWDEPQSRSVFEGAEDYADANPELFEWVGSYLTDRTFTWAPQVDALKDCDYIFPPMAAVVTFIKEYRDAGYDAKFIGTDGHAAFFGMIGQANLWDKADGMLFGLPYGWWNDDSESIKLLNQYVRENRDDYEEMIANGTSYLGPFIAFQGMLWIIEEAVQQVGAENLTSQAIYEAAQSFTMDFDGRQWGFSETSRCALDSIGIYKLDAVAKDLFRVDDDWVTLVKAP